MMRRSHIVAVGLVVLSALCLVPRLIDRGMAAIGLTTPWLDDGDYTTLRMAVWGMPFEDELFRDGYARDFETLHPTVRIKYEKYAEVAPKYFAWHVLGRGADVMRVRVTDYHALVAAGAVEPLDRFIDDTTIGLTVDEQADFTPALWDVLRIDGVRYALPSDNAQLGLYYNPKLFDRYNEQHPDTPISYPDAAWRWDDLVDAASRLRIVDASGRTVQFGIDFALGPWPFMAFFAQAGGELWDKAGTTTLIDSPAGERALAIIAELLPHAATMRSGKLTVSATGPDKLFGSGQAAMLLDGSWIAPFLEQTFPDLEFGIAPLPRDKRSAIVGGSVLWAISSHSRHKREAWEMIKWMSNREQSLRYWTALRVAPPARISVVNSPEFAEADPAANTDHDRTSWLRVATTPDSITGVAPGFVPVGPYQKDLEDLIEGTLIRAVAPNRSKRLRELLAETADALHGIIDRDRRAKGLPAVARDR